MIQNIKTLNPIEQKALGEFNQKLNRKFGSNLVLVKLFGSKARGDFHEESDIDVLVIIKNLKENDERWIIELTYDLSLKYNYIDISPRIYSEKTWHYYTALPLSFAYMVKREGIKI